MKQAGIFLGAALLIGAGALQAAPTYQAEACCTLCPAAATISPQQTPELASLGGLVEGSDGWLFSRDKDLRTRFALDEPSYGQLGRLRDALQARGVELLLVYQPSRGLLHADRLLPAEQVRFDLARARDSYRASLARLRALGLRVPDLASLLQAEAGAPDYYFKADRNWTPQGAERVARLVAQTVRATPALAGLPRAEYVSQPVGLLGRSGSLQSAAAQLCGSGYPQQFVPGYATRPRQAGPQAPAEVVLVGGGNSAEAFNFAGFLQQYLGTPVHNASQPDSGPAAALLQYLLSPAFQRQPPRLLVWEVDDGERLVQRNFYRQALAAVDDGCRGRPTLLQGQTSLAGGSRQVLFNGADGVLAIHGGDYRLELQMDAPAAEQLDATLTFMNGRQERLSFVRSPAAGGPARFVLALREDGDWAPLTFLALNVQALPAGAGGRLSASLCRVPANLRTAAAGGRR